MCLALYRRVCLRSDNEFTNKCVVRRTFYILYRDTQFAFFLSLIPSKETISISSLQDTWGGFLRKWSHDSMSDCPKAQTV